MRGCLPLPDHLRPLVNDSCPVFWNSGPELPACEMNMIVRLREELQHRLKFNLSVANC